MEPLPSESQSAVLDLVGRLYDAPDKTSLLSTLHAGLGKIFPLAPSLFYLPVDACSGRWEIDGYQCLPSGASWAREWALFYLRFDLLASTAFLDPAHHSLRYSDLTDPEDFRHSRFYREFFSRIPASFALLLPLGCHGERLGAVWLLRQEAGGEFSDRERDMGNLVGYHLSRSMLLATLRSHPPLCGQPGILVYDGGKNLLYRNDRAEAILGRSDLRWCLDHPGDPAPVLQTEKGVFHCRVLPVRPPSVEDGRSRLKGERDTREARVVILESYRQMPMISKQLKHFDLSLRQSEIVLEVVRGRSNKEIAEKLGIAIQTVKDHMHDIFRQMDVRSRTELVAAVVRGIDQEGE
ncbi:MAG: helix-turn-helix transcriptional regulator [Leptospirales bacterium]